MTHASVISIDPGKSTLGDLNPAATARALRYRVLNREAQSSASFKHLLNSVFAIGASSRAQSKGVSLLLVRMIAGTILLLCGLSAGFGNVLPTPEVLQTGVFVPSLESVAFLAAGTSLCLGLFTRIILLASAVCFGIVFGEGVAAGELLQTPALMCVLSLVFAVKGPGRLSIDALIRRSLYAAHRNRARRRAARRLSYEAFRFQNL